MHGTLLGWFVIIFLAVWVLGALGGAWGGSGSDSGGVG